MVPYDDRYAFDDLEAIAFETDDLAGVVCDQAQTARPQLRQDLCANAILAQVGIETQLLVGLDGIHALFLQRVGVDLVGQADAAALLAHIEDDALALFLDHTHGLFELTAAITATRMKDVPGQTFTMDAHERGFIRRNVAHDQGHVVVVIDLRVKQLELEVTVPRRHGHLAHEINHALSAPAVRDDVGDRGNLERMLRRKRTQLGQARHATIFLQDFTDDTRRLESGQTRQVDRGLGVTGPVEHAPLHGLQREGMARTHQVAVHALLIHQDAHGGGTVMRTDPG